MKKFMKSAFRCVHYFPASCFTWLLMREIRRGKVYKDVKSNLFYLIAGKLLILLEGPRYWEYDLGWYYDWAEDLIDYEESPFDYLI